LDRYFRALGARGDRQRTLHRRALATANVRWRCVRLPDDALRPEEARAAAELFALTVRNHGDAAPPVAFYRNLLTTWPV
ncbi:MAG TPA: hypothetical protein VEO19_15205, partial [Terriglobia bacterium]|nr:hypothetical protein [Terriglobia bacterium]